MTTQHSSPGNYMSAAGATLYGTIGTALIAAAAGIIVMNNNNVSNVYYGVAGDEHQQHAGPGPPAENE